MNMQGLSARFVGTALGLLLAFGSGEQLAAQSSLLPGLLNYAETWARMRWPFPNRMPVIKTGKCNS